jgi:hypothetical protein
MLSVTSKALFTIRWWFTCHSVGVSVACVSWPCIWIRGARSPSADARPRELDALAQKRAHDQIELRSSI